MSGPLIPKGVDEYHYVQAMSWHLRRAILDKCSNESCILSTRLACDMFTKLGFRTIPLALSVTVLNPAAVAEYDEAEKRGEKPDLDAWLEDDHPARVVGMKYDPDPEVPDPTLFFGHVALIVIGKDGGYLVDPSIDQINRPTWDIEIPPLVIDLADRLGDFIDGERIGTRVNGCAVLYDAAMEDESYREAGDWHSSPDEPDMQSIAGAMEGFALTIADEGVLPPLLPLPRSVNSTAMRVLAAAHAEKVTMSEALEVFKRRGYDIEQVLEDFAEAMDRDPNYARFISG